MIHILSVLCPQQGYTPLYVAVVENHVRVVDVLLSCGADKDITPDVRALNSLSPSQQDTRDRSWAFLSHAETSPLTFRQGFILGASSVCKECAESLLQLPWSFFLVEREICTEQHLYSSLQNRKAVHIGHTRKKKSLYSWLLCLNQKWFSCSVWISFFQTARALQKQVRFNTRPIPKQSC